MKWILLFLLISACLLGKIIYSIIDNRGNLKRKKNVISIEGGLANIRLDGGMFPHEGNIIVNEEPVCDDQFNLVIAGVACRELGYFGAITYKKDGVTPSKYGLVSPDFAMDNVVCDGTEDRLLDCTHSTV